MLFLLDTNTCVDLIRRKSRPVEKIYRSKPIASVGISTITLAELQHGVAKSSRPELAAAALAMMCAPLQILSFDQEAAAMYGEVRASLERAGTPIGPLDTLIASHALALEAVLVTNNEREFGRLPQLRIENWTE